MTTAPLPPEPDDGQDDPPDLRQLLAVLADFLAGLFGRDEPDPARADALRATVERARDKGVTLEWPRARDNTP